MKNALIVVLVLLACSCTSMRLARARRSYVRDVVSHNPCPITFYLLNEDPVRMTPVVLNALDVHAGGGETNAPIRRGIVDGVFHCVPVEPGSVFMPENSAHPADISNAVRTIMIKVAGDPDEFCHGLAIECLTKSYPDEALGLLTPFLKHTNPIVREAAQSGIQELKTERVEPEN